MNEFDWEEFDLAEDTDDLTVANKKNTKSRKRKWREIELLKEQKRFQKEMLSYDEYTY